MRHPGLLVSGQVWLLKGHHSDGDQAKPRFFIGFNPSNVDANPASPPSAAPTLTSRNLAAAARHVYHRARVSGDACAHRATRNPTVGHLGRCDAGTRDVTVASGWTSGRVTPTLRSSLWSDPDGDSSELVAHSHSIVPGGFEVMSRTTRFTCGISLIIREAIRSSRS
jgi:hypothetical protein